MKFTTFAVNIKFRFGTATIEFAAALRGASAVATRLGKRCVTLPPGLLRAALAVLHPLKLSRYGPEQVDFLRYRPVLDNRRLKEELGYTPRKTSREVFDFYCRAHGLGAGQA